MYCSLRHARCMQTGVSSRTSSVVFSSAAVSACQIRDNVRHILVCFIYRITSYQCNYAHKEKIKAIINSYHFILWNFEKNLDIYRDEIVCYCLWWSGKKVDKIYSKKLRNGCNTSLTNILFLWHLWHYVHSMHIFINYAHDNLQIGLDNKPSVRLALNVLVAL